jgi:O-methyltransferase involved in polyketide biosynthesis
LTIPSSSARISPTAHYTSYVWFRNGLSHPALTTRLGRVLHLALRPANVAYERLSSLPNLDMMLLARHRVLDHLLERAIESGRVSQVLEVAAGFSPRGFRFSRRYGAAGLVYVEADLAEQAENKRRALDGVGLRGPNHHVVAVDALSDTGPESVEAVAAAHFQRDRGTVIITEGLLGYFDDASVLGMWRRFASCLRGYARGLYLTDLNLSGDVVGMRSAAVFRLIIQAFARGKVHQHFEGPEDARAALLSAGFAKASIHMPGEFASVVEIPAAERGHMVRLCEAET